LSTVNSLAIPFLLAHIVPCFSEFYKHLFAGYQAGDISSYLAAAAAASGRTDSEITRTKIKVEWKVSSNSA